MPNVPYTLSHRDDFEAFTDAALGFLVGDEVLNTLPIGMCLQLRDRGGPRPPYFATLNDPAETVCGVVMVVPPFGAFVSALPLASASVVVEDVLRCGVPFDGVAGAPETAAAIAEAVRAATGSPIPPPWMHQKVHKLGALTLPASPRGTLSPATEEDADIVEAWCIAFAEEANLTHATSEGRRLAGRARFGDIFLWRDGDGATTSLVGVAGHSPNGCRIGPVYTPPTFRRRGHGTAATAALSAHMLAGGLKFCCLFTDAANATSNRIYASIGYRVVGETVMRSFSAPAPADDDAAPAAPPGDS